MSSKHHLSTDALPAAKRLHTLGPQSQSRPLQLSFDSLYDELILCIFSHLSATDLCAAQCINKTWDRLSTDNELWKTLYLRTFGRSRLRGSKGFTRFTRMDGLEVRPLPARASSKQEELKDWKWMFRISSNWRKGRCAIGELSGASDPSVAQPSTCRTHVLLAGNLTITASAQPSKSPTIHIFDRHSVNHSIPCKSHLRDEPNAITALAIDQSPPTHGQLRLASFLSTGDFIVYLLYPNRLAASSEILSFRPSLRRARAINVVEAVYHHPLLVTLSQEFKLSIYDLTGNAARHTQTLSSFTSFPPTSLVLSTPTLNSYKLVIAYAIPVYPAHWSVGATELIISGNAASSHVSSLLPSPPPLDPLCIASTRTTRALDVPHGWIDEDKLQAMREQWSRKLSRVADTQTDGKWIVLASGEEILAAGASRPSLSYSSEPMDIVSSTPLQLYRLYLPNSNSIASTQPKMSFVRTLHGQTGPISSLALSDGRCVSLGINGSLWVWDLEAGTGAEVSASNRRALVGRPREKDLVVFDEKQIITTEAGRVVVRRFDI